MKYFIGVDEAGYGPNLGPLVVAATLWKTDESATEDSLSRALSPDFCPRNWMLGCALVPLGDSKQLYQSSSGLATLEAGLLALLFMRDVPCQTLGEVLQRVGREHTAAELKNLLWYSGYESLPVPKTLPMEEVRRLAALASASLAANRIELIGFQAAVITEPRFNAAVHQSGSKAEILSSTTLELVVQLAQQCDAPIEIFCDRQGGRKNYLPQLLRAMPDEWFVETAISNARSSYQNSGAQKLQIHFSVGGDRFPPTALASMLAKYLRERLMEPLNAFWSQHVSGLRPTAGYPVDAQRFRAEIEPIAQKMQLPLAQWWRCK